MVRIKGWKRRTEKIMYGNLWTIKRTYKINNSVIGEIVKNPFTDKYEARASDFINRRYITSSFDKLSKARNFILSYAIKYMKTHPRG